MTISAQEGPITFDYITGKGKFVLTPAFDFSHALCGTPTATFIEDSATFSWITVHEVDTTAGTI